MENPPKPPSPSASIQYSQPAENELILVYPYLNKFDFEDEEDIDDERYELEKRFLRQVRESKGYDVDCLPLSHFNPPFLPLIQFMKSKEYYDIVMNATEVAIRKINAETGKTFKLMEVEKAVWNQHPHVSFHFYC